MRQRQHEPNPGDRPLPHVRYNATAGPTGDANFEMWHELCRPAFDTGARGTVDRFRADFDWYFLDGLNCTRAEYAPTRFCRSAEHVARGGGDLVVLHLVRRGRETVEIDGRPVLMAPDRVVLIDWSRPFVRESSAVEQLSISIPRHLLPVGRRLHEERPVLTWGLDSAFGRLLAGAMVNLWDDLPRLKLGDTPPVTAGFLGLLGGLIETELGDTLDSDRLRSLMRAAMQAYLVRHLGHPSLGVTDLIRAFHCSRSSIYRLFEDCGGVHAFIREQRLSHSRRMLRDPDRSGQTIGRIAQSCGFEDPAYFHRRFKQRFGLTPGEARRGHAEPAGRRFPGELGDPHHHGLRTIHRGLGLGSGSA